MRIVDCSSDVCSSDLHRRVGLEAHVVEGAQHGLALEVGVNPAALVRTLDRGEAAGLLERNAVSGDRRSNAVSLLPKGEKLAKAMERRVADLRQIGRA